jgi:hypothetical protein
VSKSKDEVMRELVARMRERLAEINADIEALALDHGVETQATMQTLRTMKVGPQHVLVRRLYLAFLTQL